MKEKANNWRPQITVTMPEDVYQRLCKESDALGISRAAYITMTLKQRWSSEAFTENMPEVIKALNQMVQTTQRLETDRKGHR